MAEPIVVTVELVDADFVKDYEVDPDSPLVELVQRVCTEEQIPLRTKTGRPIAWTAEGPEWREGKEEGWTDLVRTQPLTKLAEKMREAYGGRSPLFTVRVSIPGAKELIAEARGQAQRDEIERRLAERAAERDQEEAERRAELTKDAEDWAAPADDSEADTDAVPTIPPRASLPPPPPQQPARAPAPAPRAPGPAPGSLPPLPAAPAPPPAARPPQAPDGNRAVESRIRRAGAARAPEPAADPDVVPTEQMAAVPKKGGAPAALGPAKGKGKGGKPGPAAGKAAPGAGKAGKGGKTRPGAAAGGGILGLPTWALAAGAGVVVLGLVGMLVAVLSGEDPPPPPEPTPAAVVEVPADVPMAAPEPTAAPAVEATPPPPSMEVFFSLGEVTRSSASGVGPRISSFGKSDVRVTYTVRQDGPGSHSIGLKGRFTVTVSESGFLVDAGGGRPFEPGVPVGGTARVDLRYDGKELKGRVGKRGFGPYPIPDPGGFPSWQLTLDPTVTLTNLAASAPVLAEGGGG